MADQPTPLKPRITKSTSLAVINGLFPKTSDMLKRFELVSKPQASLWDGERDGLREAIKATANGQYDNVILTKATGAPVSYVNAEGKHYVEDCMICTIPAREVEGGVIAFQYDGGTVEKFLDLILHNMQQGKDQALNLLNEMCIGNGDLVDNDSLYKSEGATKSTITILPEPDEAA